MVNRTRDFAKNNNQVTKRPVAKPKSRPWLGALILTAVLMGSFIFALFHLYKTSKYTHHQNMSVKREANSTTPAHSSINKPRFEFYSILKQDSKTTNTNTTVTQPQPAVKLVSNTKKYFLQVAALKRTVDVTRLKTHLSSMGYKVQIQQFDNHGSVWNRVSLGPYLTQAKAEAEQQRLKLNHYPTILRKVDM